MSQPVFPVLVFQEVEAPDRPEQASRGLAVIWPETSLYNVAAQR